MQIDFKERDRTRHWIGPFRSEEFCKGKKFPLHDRLFSAARQDFICVRRNMGSYLRKKIALLRLPILKIYFLMFFGIYFRIGFPPLMDMVASGTDQCWKYLYNFHSAAKIGCRRF
jgi:hypothetical protein